MKGLLVGLFAVAVAAAAVPAPLAAKSASNSAAAPAPWRPLLDALRRNFPSDYAALAPQLAGQSPDVVGRLMSTAMERFTSVHLQAIVAAPGRLLVGLEARHAAMLRALRKRDVRLCAVLGDRGFFGPEARAASPAPLLPDYAIALVEAARSGAGRAPSSPPTKEDYEAWLAEVTRLEPSVPVRAMLSDRDLRVRSSPENLCAGAAAMHEAVGNLSQERASRLAATLVKSL